jgi:hypothetical protein
VLPACRLKKMRARAHPHQRPLGEPAAVAATLAALWSGFPPARERCARQLPGRCSRRRARLQNLACMARGGGGAAARGLPLRVPASAGHTPACSLHGARASASCDSRARATRRAPGAAATLILSCAARCCVATAHLPLVFMECVARRLLDGCDHRHGAQVARVHAAGACIAARRPRARATTGMEAHAHSAPSLALRRQRAGSQFKRVQEEKGGWRFARRAARSPGARPRCPPHNTPLP